MTHHGREETATYESIELASWDEIEKAFDSFPRPKLDVDADGEPSQDMWIFRGQKKGSYGLQPSIEREATPSTPWAALEYKILWEEFQPEARMLMDASTLPGSEDVLSWLALMQHYGVPTRLLDVTLSPYVALYFAFRNRTREEMLSSHVAVWAIDGRALMTIAARVNREEVKQKAREPQRFPRPKLSQLVASAWSVTDAFRTHSEGGRRMLSEALSPRRVRRNYFDKSGFVAFALPSTHNRRLSCQQGAFLFNGAEKPTFQQSLFKMMSGSSKGWCRQLLIPNTLATRKIIEDKLFQMNIHELSLFPDMEGLAGFVRQKLRLYWVPGDSTSGEEI
ncbi:MAG: FRG domain-containing protein [Terriglobia bacterium]|jgi:hypothetical protein